MVISAYQVNNVLRVYRNQLRQGRVSGGQSNSVPQSADRISISSGGKQKALMDKISSGIAEKINQYGMLNEIGKETPEKPEYELGHLPGASLNGSGDLVYKMVDDQGESINIFSLNNI